MPKPSNDYQSILRAIGQGIEKLEVESFDLEFADTGEFVVSGVYKENKRAATPKPNVTAPFLSLIMSAAKGGAKPAAHTTFYKFTGIRFGHNDIDLLDRAGKASRKSWDANPQNPLGVAHVLRMAGAYLDKKGSRFSRLLWQHGTLTVWHFNESGGEAKDIFTPENLYDNWVHHFKARKPNQSLKATGRD